MSDYIDRQEAIKLLEWWAGGYSYIEVEAAYAVSAFKDLPPADVVPVVRCKDCKHYQFAPERAFGRPVKRCEVTGFEDVEDNDFCSRGARRDGKQDESR